MRPTTLVLALALLLSACAADSGQSAGPDTAAITVDVDADTATNPATLGDPSEHARLTGLAAALTGDWELVQATMDGEALPLVDSAPITLTATPSGFSGNAACNSYSADVTVDGDVLSLDHMAVTRMACDEARMTVEGLYVTALEQITGFTAETDGLLLTGPGVELRYRPTGT